MRRPETTGRETKTTDNRERRARNNNPANQSTLTVARGALSLGSEPLTPSRVCRAAFTPIVEQQ
jgi:hypothetical protein